MLKNEIKASGNYVVLKLEKAVETDKTKSGILIVNKKDKYDAIVYSIGPDVKNVNFKKGDNVVFNEYDKKAVEIEETIFVIVQAKNIMAIITKNID